MKSKCIICNAKETDTICNECIKKLHINFIKQDIKNMIFYRQTGLSPREALSMVYGNESDEYVKIILASPKDLEAALQEITDENGYFEINIKDI